jgi:predicted NAD-dependent protein-ADP-ribosyltransferase YbiA (DUF1768 family)
MFTPTHRSPAGDRAAPLQLQTARTPAVIADFYSTSDAHGGFSDFSRHGFTLKDV